jgi:hypothetical protein
MSPTLAISTPHAPGARAFKVGGPGNVDSQFQETTTIEPLHFDVPYMFQRGKLGKGDEGRSFILNITLCRDFISWSLTLKGYLQVGGIIPCHVMMRWSPARLSL